MSRARTFALLAGLALAVGLVTTAAFPTAAPAAPAPTPTIELSTSLLVPGSEVALHGTHWSEDTVLQATLCGANAVDGSVNCVGRAAVTMTPGPTGVVDGTLHVFMPPDPCPCVVLVSGLTSSFSRRLPVQVAGAATAPPKTASPLAEPPTLRVDTEVSGGTTLASFFGGPAERTLTVRIRNTGSIDIAHPVLAVGWGRSGSADHLIRTPRLGPIAAGATRTVKVPFELDAFAMGNYEVAGRVTGASKPVPVSATTSTWPWGLFAVALVLLQFILLGIRNRVRRHLARKQVAARVAAAAAAAAEAGTSPTGGVPVVAPTTPSAASASSASSVAPVAIRWRPLEPIRWSAAEQVPVSIDTRT